MLAIGGGDFPANRFDPSRRPEDLLDDVVLRAWSGSPTRRGPRRRQAVAECRGAGIRAG